MKEFFSERQLAIIKSPTPKEHIEEKTEGNRKVKYVTGSYVKSVLNELFSYNWQENIIKTDFFPGSNKNTCVIVHIRLTGFTDDGLPVIKEQYGGSYVENSLPYAYKAAATDALKKCASEIGLFADVYTDEKPAEPVQEDPLMTIDRLTKECFDCEIVFTKTDAAFFRKTIDSKTTRNYTKCIDRLNIYLSKIQKQK